MPDAAVTSGGQETVSAGSTSATAGSRLFPRMLFLSGLPETEMTALGVTSAPVPLVVGTSMHGSVVSPSALRLSTYSAVGASAWTSTAMAFAASIALPPPSPITRSHFSSRQSARPASTSAVVGSPAISSNSRASTPAAASNSHARSVTPALRIAFRPVTISARRPSPAKARKRFGSSPPLLRPIR